jgi:hypothetical protein
MTSVVAVRGVELQVQLGQDHHRHPPQDWRQLNISSSAGLQHFTVGEPEPFCVSSVLVLVINILEQFSYTVSICGQ